MAQTQSSSRLNASNIDSRHLSPTGAAERDETYDLISILYHSLQGAETVSQYIEDADWSEDQEMLQFFEETRDEYNARARRARVLLATRLDGRLDDNDDNDGAARAGSKGKDERRSKRGDQTDSGDARNRDQADD